MHNWVNPLFSGYLYGQFKFFRARKIEGFDSCSWEQSSTAGRCEDAGRHSAEAEQYSCPGQHEGTEPGSSAAWPFIGETLHMGTNMPLVFTGSKIRTWGAQDCVSDPSKKGYIRLEKKNELVLACLYALFPLLQSQLDSVPLLNKYLLNLLLTTFQLIRAGIALEILYELSPSRWLIFVFHSSGRVIYYFCLYLIISDTSSTFFSPLYLTQQRLLQQIAVQF